MTAARIICVGNRHVEGDDTGPRVFDRLRTAPLPAGVEIVDGGLAGLDLLRYFEQVRRVVVVDAIAGFGAPGEIRVLDQTAIAACCTQGRWGHEAGIPYLVAMLPRICDGEPPEVFLLGVEAPANDDAISALARDSVALATGGMGKLEHG